MRWSHACVEGLGMIPVNGTHYYGQRWDDQGGVLALSLVPRPEWRRKSVRTLVNDCTVRAPAAAAATASSCD